MSRRSRRARAPPAHPAPPPRPSSPDASGPRAAAASRPLPRGSRVSRKSCPAAPPSCRPRARRPPARAAPPSSPFLGPAASHIPRLARPARGSHPLQTAPRETRARSSRAAGVGAGIRSPGRSFLEDQGDGSVIHELHLHHCPEFPGLNPGTAPRSPLPEERDKPLVQRDRELRRAARGGPPPAPPPPPSAGCERGKADLRARGRPRNPPPRLGGRAFFPPPPIPHSIPSPPPLSPSFRGWPT